MLAITPLLLTFLLTTASATAAPVVTDDEKAIRQAVLNYVDAAYRLRPELVEESVHPRLQKVGYVARSGGAGYDEAWMTFQELRSLVRKWNKDGKADPDGARRDIKILDRLDQIAVARLDANWGTDFFHLARIDGTWKIVNVIWQTPPTKVAAQK